MGPEELEALKKSMFTTEPIISALRQAEAGLGVDEMYRKLGVAVSCWEFPESGRRGSAVFSMRS